MRASEPAEDWPETGTSLRRCRDVQLYDMRLRFRMLENRSDCAPPTDWSFLPMHRGILVSVTADRLSRAFRRLLARWSETSSAGRQIRVSSMSDAWLQVHTLEYDKHHQV